jgi:hypothetical protein
MKKIVTTLFAAGLLVACSSNPTPNDAGTDASVSDAAKNDAATTDASTDAADSGCGDTQTDPKNCGACGNKCINNHCTAGVCDHVVFLSSYMYFVDLGELPDAGGATDPLAAADTDCNTLAQQWSLSGTYKAWLATANGAPATRFTKSTTPYVLSDGTTVVANNWTDLTKGTLQHAIDLTEQKTTDTDLATRRTMTNVATDGTLANPSADCSAWTSKAANIAPTIGDSKVATAEWTKMAAPDALWTCGLQYHIYCFQQ